ncbi:glycogen synthase [Thiosulfatimonas sediminis]|uniref:Glycogen synthase n=1 Tax=Thiosulfatimonas sediminis TaxID=2675054 RepID=A0A6F8PSW6_9GAMM|nr:glycogen synthase GlgA [Thiosulfatimonas sediminis]BBP45080.1 glycogen synthase [Thiosulfatimonas sediminis]
MKILYATSEAHPLIKTGGLADVSGSLPNALKALKNHVRLVLPAYYDVLQKLPKKSFRKVADLRVGGCSQFYDVRILQLSAGAFNGLDVPVWLVDIPALFGRSGNPYLAADGTDWWDNGERFGVFSKVVTELAMDRVGLKWQPDVVHLNDWQTGLVSALLSLEAPRPKTVFTIHNMAYPGNFPQSLFHGLGLPPYLWSMHGVEFWGHFSLLKAGVAFADWVTTVSPTYAAQICHYEFAYGFEGLLQQRAAQGRLVGILNGIDDQVWNPQTDALIPYNYSADKGRVAAKRKNKVALLKAFCRMHSEKTLPNEDCFEQWIEKPLIGFVGRLVPQKGIDLVMQVLPDILQNSDANIAVVGSGDKQIEAAICQLAKRFPQRVWCHIGYSEELAHLVEAGSDMFLMPSRFEPCGLNQMYSLAYGTPPIVHNTGGLADTVVDASEENLQAGTATGFVFDEMSPAALSATIMHALALFGKKRQWQKMQKTGMLQAFDWKKSAQAYQALYLTK